MQAFNFIWTLAVLMIVANFKAQSQNIHYSAHAETETVAPRKRSLEFYNSLREMFLRYEESKTLGADITLTEKELQVNQILMDVKTKEYEQGVATPHLFTPSQHIFEVLETIKQSSLFKCISDMPKGGVLHAHDTALCSTDFLINLTYRENLWICQATGDMRAVSLKFSNSTPTSSPAKDCTWELLSKVRDLHGAEKVDSYLREHLTLYPKEKFLDNNEAWKDFIGIFALLNGLLFYAPVWADYYYQALKEFRADGVQYLEFRSTLPILYDLEGTKYTAIDTVRIYKETLDKFMNAHPDFIGSKLIYAPLRNADMDVFDQYVKTCVEIKAKYPDFVAGFDLVGQEEMGRPLKDFIPQLLNMPDNIDFFFHAGETNWLGSSVDENLIDAVLLGTKRIGHGFALIKHPLVLQLLKENDIAVEVNPISNQVLQLVADYRNHPCSHLFANNYPVVISSDDPSFWKATPLSHDFYIAFLGIASAHSDIRLLKKLALNSITYSSMSAEEKLVALEKWQMKWEEYIDKMLKDVPLKSAAVRGLHTNRVY